MIPQKQGKECQKQYSPTGRWRDDSKHQQEFEVYGALVEYAKTLNEKGKAGDAYALTEAKNYARLILGELWGNSVNTIYMTPTSFIHKGLQIIKEGKATHLYKFNQNLMVAKTMVSPDSSFKNDIEFGTRTLASSSKGERREYIYYQL